MPKKCKAPDRAPALLDQLDELSAGLIETFPDDLRTTGVAARVVGGWILPILHHLHPSAGSPQPPERLAAIARGVGVDLRPPEPVAPEPVAPLEG